MNKQKYTSGPWEALGNKIFSPSDRWGTIAKLYSGPDEVEFEANARLLAGAPELLEALKELLSATIDYDIKHCITLTEAEREAQNLCLSVIAKAEGIGS